MWYPQLGSFSPGKFIAIVEECALIVPIGREVLRSDKRRL